MPHQGEGGTVQGFAESAATPLGDPSLSLVDAGGDFIQVQAGQLDERSGTGIRAQIACFSDQRCDGDRTDPWDGSQHRSIGNLVQGAQVLVFNFSDLLG